VLLGAANVGKTCIICRAVSNEFDPEMQNTIGACYTAKPVDTQTASVNLQIWDTAGQERFRTLAPMYYRGSVVAVLVFSLVDDHSLSDVQSWADEIKSQAEELPVLFVVGNKMDLERKIPIEQGETVARSLKATYCEVSAKSGRGIEELFLSVAEAAVKKIKGGIDRPTSAAGVEITTPLPSPKRKKKFC
jgi:small GTP-binding protein